LAGTIEGPARLWQSRRPLVIFLPLFAVSLVLLVPGGNWAFYSLRIAVVLLIALFAYQDQSPGEFLGVCTWLFGGRAGFDCGIAGEISLVSLRALESEVEKAIWAFSLKGISINFRCIVPFSARLLYDTLRRAYDQADLLVARGYSKGGSCCVRFQTSKRDIELTVAAIVVGIAAFLPFGEFFILLQ
jgi:energy-coupling factor transport system permease protein